jgi:PBP1b-binding outer membrane lipoprotein LpoB
MKYITIMLSLVLLVGCQQKPVPDASGALSATVTSAAESNRSTLAHINTARTALNSKNFPAATQAVDNAGKSADVTAKTLGNASDLAEQNQKGVAELNRRNAKLQDQNDDFFSVQQKRILWALGIASIVMLAAGLFFRGRFSFLSKLFFWRKT